MFEMTTLSIPGVLPYRPLMSSKEISKLTGKRHSDILRDIRSVLNELYADDYHNAKLRYEKISYLQLLKALLSTSITGEWKASTCSTESIPMFSLPATR